MNPTARALLPVLLWSLACAQGAGVFEARCQGSPDPSGLPTVK